jgi:hypothetical protein
MTIQIFETFDSRALNDGLTTDQQLRYIVTGTDTEQEVIDTVLATAPSVFGVLRRVGFSAEPLGGGIWDITVPYETRKESQWSFETGGATTRITQSLQTVARYAASGATAPDFQGAIGVNGDTVDGVDVTVPVYNFTETVRKAGADVTQAYKLAIFACTGKTNNATFRGFAAGEVLFLGASGTKTGVDDWEIAFKFAASPNVTNLSIGGGITASSKKGWEYLWVRFADKADTTAQVLVKRPVAAYVERVYESANFSTLGLG